MARAIDKDKLITSMVWYDQHGMISTIDDVLDIIEDFPTLTPPNKPLTCDVCTKQGEPDCYTRCSQGIRDPRVCDYYDPRLTEEKFT